jgi:hypothetical protein
MGHLIKFLGHRRNVIDGISLIAAKLFQLGEGAARRGSRGRKRKEHGELQAE